MPQVITVLYRYPRKRAEKSVWIVEGAGKRTQLEADDYISREDVKNIFCLHPVTDMETANAIAEAWRTLLSTSPKAEEVIERLMNAGL